MDTDPSKSIRDIIDQTHTLDLPQRNALIAKLASENPTLASEATAMFQLQDEGILSEELTIEWSSPSHPENEATCSFEIGSVIGPYTLISQLGEGGMGTVFLAEQTQPVLRKVALKLLHIDDENKNQANLLASEIQALAYMNHSFIAKVFNTGMTSKGAPWFAMEWVKGQPITQYCDTHALSIQDRLKLFVKVCTGIQHAHMRGIIHRDIKPANILISSEEGEPTPKIIDFGVAKSIDQGNPQLRLVRRDNGVAGTPTYMSPEQVCNPAEVDTRTDIYSLGLLLFELIVGVQPFVMGETTVFSIIHRVVNGDCPEPLTFFGQLGQEAEAVARARRMHSAELHRVLKGDLSSIVEKAMSKNRDDRYESVADFAEDIQHWIEGEPVSAHTGGSLYRLTKFMKRHRIGTAAALFSTLSLLVGLFFSVFHYAQTVRAKEMAAREAQKAWSINQFLTDMLASADPDLYGADVKVVDVLDMASMDLNQAFEENPEIEARLRETIGETYSQLGQLEKADREVEQAVELATSTFGKHHIETLKARGLRGLVWSRKGHYNEAELELEEVLKQLREQKTLNRKEYQKTTIHLAAVKTRLGKNDEARKLLRSLETELLAQHPADTTTLLTVHNNLAQIMVKEKQYEKASDLLSGVYKKRKELMGPDHPRTLTALNNLALVYEKMKKREEAISLQREVLNKRTEVLGEDHPQTLHSMDNLAISLMRSRQFAESDELLNKSLELRRKVFGPLHTRTLKTEKNCIINALGLKNFTRARDLSQDYFDKCRQVFGPVQKETLFAQTTLGICYENLKQYRKAFDIYSEASRAASQALPLDHPQVLALNTKVGKTLRALKRYSEAEPVLLNCLEAYRKKSGLKSPYTRRILNELVLLYKSWGKPIKEKKYRALIN